MADIFFEGYIRIISYGLVILVPLTILAVNFRKKEFWFATIGVFTLMITLLIVERMVVTPREQLRATVHEIARIVETNDVDKLMTKISKRFDEARSRANSEMRNYEFTFCNIVSVNKLDWDPASPDKGSLDFTASARVAHRGVTGPVLRDVTLVFEKESDGEWRIVDYSHRKAFQQDSMF